MCAQHALAANAGTCTQPSDRAGAGYNTIDVAAASTRGIYVSNCPGKNAIAVAELAFALILSLDRRVPDNVADLRAGRWNKQEYGKARGLYGRTLGLLGFGNIGQEVAIRARAFGMPVVVWSQRFAADAEERARVSAALSSVPSRTAWVSASQLAAAVGLVGVGASWAGGAASTATCGG